DSSQFVNGHVNHVYGMVDDYSYDLFSQKSVPFKQIALHGLVSYSLSYVNEREEYEVQLLRDLEYGALPAFIFTAEPTRLLNESFSLRLFSSQFEEWSEETVRQYQIYNDVLNGLQDQFIVNHRELAYNVFETTYENGTKVVVNYNQGKFAQ